MKLPYIIVSLLCMGVSTHACCQTSLKKETVSTSKPTHKGTTVEYLRDRNGAVVGSLREQGESKYVHGRDGQVLGRFDPSTNTTFDRDGRVVGYGDQTSRLAQ